MISHVSHSYSTAKIVELLKAAEIDQCAGEPTPGWCIETGRCTCHAIAEAAKLLSQSPGPASPNSCRQIVERHRRHVEVTAALSAPVRDYALMVCDDILSDLPRAATSESDK